MLPRVVFISKSGVSTRCQDRNHSRQSKNLRVPFIRVPENLHFYKSIVEHSLRLTYDAVLEILESLARNEKKKSLPELPGAIAEVWERTFQYSLCLFYVFWVHSFTSYFSTSCILFLRERIEFSQPRFRRWKKSTTHFGVSTTLLYLFSVCYEQCSFFGLTTRAKEFRRIFKNGL